METFETNEGKVIETEITYSLGGWNYFTGMKEARGYYLHCTPMWVDKNKTGHGNKIYTAFTGVKTVLLTVKRKSKKAEETAKELAKEILDEVVLYVCKKNNLTLKDPESINQKIKTIIAWK